MPCARITSNISPIARRASASVVSPPDGAAMAGSPCPACTWSARAASVAVPAEAVPLTAPGAASDRGTEGPCAPVGPSGPAGPALPRGPVRPAGPSGPGTPAGPAGPIEPMSPFGPRSPCGPADPVSPRGPGGPGSPVGDRRVDRRGLRLHGMHVRLIGHCVASVRGMGRSRRCAVQWRVCRELLCFSTLSTSKLRPFHSTRP
jgi:hypothetical protein